MCHAASMALEGPVRTLAIAMVLTAKFAALMPSACRPPGAPPGLTTTIWTTVDLPTIALAADIEEGLAKTALGLTYDLGHGVRLTANASGSLTPTRSRGTVQPSRRPQCRPEGSGG